MAVSTYGINDAATVKTWSKVTAMEAEKQLDIKPLMGKGPNSIIQVKDELTKSAGDRVTFLLNTQLKGEGVTENQKMEGNEEALTTYSDSILVNELNHSVRIKAEGTIEDQRVLFNAREAAYRGLGQWFADRKSLVFFAHACGYTAPTIDFEGTTYNMSSVFNGNNTITAPSANRVLRAAAAANDESLISTNILDLSLIDKAVERAKLANPQIRPVNIDGAKKYVMYIHPTQTTQLRGNTSPGQWSDITKLMWTGAKENNPFYTGALGEYNNVILRESEHVTMGVNSASGAKITTVRRAVLLGAQAIAYAEGQSTNGDYKIVEETFDYGREFGVGGKMIFGMKKIKFGGGLDDFGGLVVSTAGVAA